MIPLRRRMFKTCNYTACLPKTKRLTPLPTADRRWPTANRAASDKRPSAVHRPPSNCLICRSQGAHPPRHAKDQRASQDDCRTRRDLKIVGSI